MQKHLESAYISVHERSGCDDVVFVFSHVDTAPGSFSFWRQVGSLPANVVYVNSGRNNWYLDGVMGLTSSVAETASLLSEVAADLKCRNVYTFGASMGGYAAGLFGAILRARRVLMISAEIELGLAGSRSQRFMEIAHQRPYSDITELILAANTTEFMAWVGDSEPVDLLCADKIRLGRNVNVHVLPDCGHFAAKRMHECGLLRKALRALLSGQRFSELEDHKAFWPELCVRKLHYFLSEFLVPVSQDMEGRYLLVSKAMKLESLTQEEQYAYHLAMASAFHHRKNYRAAAIASTEAIHADPKKWEAYAALSSSLWKQGKAEKAQRALSRAISRGYIVGTSETP